MIKTACSLGQLRDAVAQWIEIHGEDCRIGVEVFAPIEGESENVRYRCVDDSGLTMDWVYCDDYGRVVGTEGDDYQPKEGEIAAVIVI